MKDGDEEQLDLLSWVPKTGRELKDASIEQVLDNNAEWREAVMDYFRVWIGEKGFGFEFIAEDFRKAAMKAGLIPNHPNAWGGLFARIVETGLVVNTGRLEAMKIPSSHARMTFVYRKEI